MKRRKVNCVCRCTPRQGIETLDPRLLRELYDQRLDQLLRETDPQHIAHIGQLTGDLMLRSGHPLMALSTWQYALSHLLCADEDRQWDYAHSYRPYYAPHHVPWSERISDTEALQLAQRIDDLYRHLGHPEWANTRRTVRSRYNSTFEELYGESIADLYDDNE